MATRILLNHEIGESVFSLEWRASFYGGRGGALLDVESCGREPDGLRDAMAREGFTWDDLTKDAEQRIGRAFE